MVSDVYVLSDILCKLGAHVTLSKGCASIDAQNISNRVVPLEESKVIRASILLTGALLARTGDMAFTRPGGCIIGNRPIDVHLSGLKALGAELEQVNTEYLRIKAKRLVGNQIRFEYPSVSATETLIIAACLAEGNSYFENVAKEPEVVDMCNCLIRMGAKIKGAGTPTIEIEGVDGLVGTEHTLIPDRIETGTYMIAAAITGGDIVLQNTDLGLMKSVKSKLEEAGVGIDEVNEGTRITSTGKIRPMNVTTEVYPGFPTDMQPIITPLLSMADGESTIRETIFDNRFKHVHELRKMGARIEVRNDLLIIAGNDRLKGTEVEATDIRAGASLIMAGLIADGETVIDGVQFILRGYEDPLTKLKNVGAQLHFAN
jgi:UDP-N-acetylglucosamine 1-carboxyvinyltransferase